MDNKDYRTIHWRDFNHWSIYLYKKNKYVFRIRQELDSETTLLHSGKWDISISKLVANSCEKLWAVDNEVRKKEKNNYHKRMRKRVRTYWKSAKNYLAKGTLLDEIAEKIEVPEFLLVAFKEECQRITEELWKEYEAKKQYEKFNNIFKNFSSDSRTEKESEFKDSLMKNIIRLLDRWRLEDADIMYDDYKKILWKDFLKTVLKPKKKELLMKMIVECLSYDNFQKAEFVYSENKELLSYKEYKAKYNEAYSSFAITQLKDFISADEYKKAEKYYNDNTEYIPEERFNKLYWYSYSIYITNKINKSFSNWDVKECKRIFNQNKSYISQEMFDELLSIHLIEDHKENIRSLISKSFIESDVYVRKHKLEFERDWYMQLKIKKINEHIKYDNQPNDAQFKSMLDVSQNLLIKARAWTWKSTTLTYKIEVLNKLYDIDSNHILIFGFNSSTAEEINEKIQKKWIPYFDGWMTFHRFAGSMVLGYWREERWRVVSNRDGSEHNKSVIIQSILTKLLWGQDHKVLMDLMYDFFRKEIDELSQASLGMGMEMYYEKIRWQKLEWALIQETLNWEVVKSIWEKWIADFLFEYDIRYRYEPNVYINDEDGKTTTCEPDFIILDIEQTNQPRLDSYKMLEEHQVYFKKTTWWLINRIKKNDAQNMKKLFIEHRWINLNDKAKWVPHWWGKDKTRDKYRDWVKWKREMYTKNWYSMIETGIWLINYSSPEARIKFEKYLKEQLESFWIKCEKLPKDELLEKIKIKQTTAISLLCSQYITKAKQIKLSSQDMHNKMSEYLYPDKSYYFYQLANLVFESYEKFLKSEWLVDMEDILRDAWTILATGKDVTIKRKNLSNELVEVPLKDIEYVMVDEYQDCNLLFYELIKWIRSYNDDLRLVCVWDDWQLINAFAWSNIRFFEKFSELFPPSSTILLQETYRCPNYICNLANTFFASEWGSYSKKEKYELKWFDRSKVYIENNSSKSEYADEKRFFPKSKVFKTDKKWKKIKNASWENIPLLWEDWKGIYENVRAEYNWWYAQNLKCLFDIIVDNFSLDNIFILSRTNKPFGRELYRTNTQLISLLTEWYKEQIKAWVFEKMTLNAIDELITKKISFENIHSSKWKEADLVIIVEIWSNKFPMLHPHNRVN